MSEKASAELELSAHCLVDHLEALGTGFSEFPLTPQTVLRRIMLYIDRKAHFVGLRGGIWRILGVDRSEKNPNLCNV